MGLSSDVFIGDDVRDYVETGGGDDVIDTGAGDDVVVVQGEGDVVVDTGSGVDVIEVDTTFLGDITVENAEESTGN